MSILHAGIEALFGRNRDHHRKRSLFRLLRRHDDHKEETDELASCFSDKPNTEKELIQGDHFGYAAMQGWRSTMEDKHKQLPCFDSRSWKLWSYYSIFDGHNGKYHFNNIYFYFTVVSFFSQGSIQRNMLLINWIFIYFKP